MQLPPRIIAGYASWGQCDDRLVQAVADGVNVLIWFAVNLVGGGVSGGPDLACVRDIAHKIAARGFVDTVHLISVGGWNAPHIDTAGHSPEEYYAAWHKWNSQAVADPVLFPSGFHGFDWDLEGNDDPRSPFNTFTAEGLHFMGRFSQLAKSNGYIVSMAPAESYLDPYTHDFSRNLQWRDENWERVKPGLNFEYHGKNCYAYLLAKYGKTGKVDTFDFITVQLYEGYSRTLFQIDYQKVQPWMAIVEFVEKISRSPWTVRFSLDPDVGLNDMKIAVPHDKLVIGLANGWANDGKFLLVMPDQVRFPGDAIHTLRRD
ncbi:hypothetical protein HDU83_005325 [Entophlyctis luteolus]|nr:hypothetical protein HDU83_005325 [Entophlyctis luteolus]KAJ3389533.1 hypothetical protein HDU84_008644 [Entophlyctis sp. JEL0112]